MLEVTKYDVTIRLTEDMLGTVPLNRNVYSDYIASKGREMLEKAEKQKIPMASGEEVDNDKINAALTEEVQTIEEVEARGHTGFHKDSEGAFVYDYWIKGFLCEAARTIREIGELKQLQDKFKRYVFVRPRRIRLPENKIEGVDFSDKTMLQITDKGVVCERPLRAQTAQGPRVTVVRSDVILSGAEIKFRLDVLPGGKISKKVIETVLEYGQYIGLGQWRTASHGRFEVVKLDKA